MRDSDRVGSTAGPAVLPGAEVRRRSHGVTFYFRIDPELARVTADVGFGAAIVRSLDMTHVEPVQGFDLEGDGGRAKGSLMARFNGPPRKSAVQGDFVVEPPDGAGAAERVFRGDIVVWDSPEKLVLDRSSSFVAPTVEVRVDITDSTIDQTSRDPIGADIRVLYVNQVVAAATVSSTAPMVKIRAIRVGSIEIDEDSVVLYRPATQRQTGQVWLTMKGRDIYGAEFEWDGAVADWEHGVVRPRDASGLPQGFEAEPAKLLKLAEVIPVDPYAARAAASNGDEGEEP